jgi:tetratricopeptide (TPR) repeat protein
VGETLPNNSTVSEPRIDSAQTASGERLHRKPLSRRFAGWGIVALALVAGGVSLRNAWQQTRLKEADLPQLKQQAKTDAGNGAVHVVLGARLAQANDYNGAAKEFEKAIYAGELSPDVWLAWSASKAAAGWRAEAGAVLQLGMKDSASAPALKAAIERVRPLPPDATPEQLAAAISPDGVAPLLKRYAPGSYLDTYSAWQGKRDPEQSGFATREAWAKAEPNNVTALRLWGEALTQNRRAKEATDVLKKALELAPDSPEVRLAYANALLEGGAPATAGTEVMKIFKQKPNWTPALKTLGRVALEKNLITMSVDVYKRLIAAAPDDPEVWIGAGKAYYNQRQNFTESVNAYAKAAQMAPTRTDFYNDYSNAHRANGNFAEAEKLLRKRLADEPADARAHFLLALVLLDSNVTPEREAEAEKSLRESLRLEPGVATTLSRLGRLLVDQGKYADAVPILKESLGEDLYNVAATRALLRALERTGQKEDAEKVRASLKDLTQYVDKVQFLEDQLRRQPLNAPLHRKMAALLLQGGETQKAQIHSEAAIMLERDPKRAAEGLTNLRDAITVEKHAKDQGK